MAMLQRVWDILVPSYPRHTLERWVRFQQIMNKKRWFEGDVEKNGPVTLWDFSFKEDALAIPVEGNDKKRGGTWRLLDDSLTIGGYSQSRVNLIQTPQDYYRTLIEGRKGNIEESKIENEEEVAPQSIVADRTETPPNDGNCAATFENADAKDTFVPFIRWQGYLDTRVNKDFNPRLQRSGFASLLSPSVPVLDLQGRYNGIEFTVRTDGRPYSIQLKVESYIPDDLYQCFINVPATTTAPNPNEDSGTIIVPLSTDESFDRVVLLFQHFCVTGGSGKLRAMQRELDTKVKIHGIHVTLMDGQTGEFCLDIARIRAVNYDETGVVGQVD